MRTIVTADGHLVNTYKVDGDTLRSEDSQDLTAGDVPCNAGEIAGRSIDTWLSGTRDFVGVSCWYVSRSCVHVLGDPFALGGARSLPGSATRNHRAAT